MFAVNAVAWLARSLCGAAGYAPDATLAGLVPVVLEVMYGVSVTLWASRSPEQASGGYESSPFFFVIVASLYLHPAPTMAWVPLILRVAYFDFLYTAS